MRQFKQTSKTVWKSADGWEIRDHQGSFYVWVPIGGGTSRARGHQSSLADALKEARGVLS